MKERKETSNLRSSIYETVVVKKSSFSLVVYTWLMIGCSYLTSIVKLLPTSTAPKKTYRDIIRS